jgi:hypothetical protein
MAIKKSLSTFTLLACMALGAHAGDAVTELSVRYDGGGGDPLHSVAMDGEGNIYLSGGRGNSAGIGANYYYVAKFDAFGKAIWSRDYQPSPAASYIGQRSSIAVDRNGNVFMAMVESYNYGAVVKFDPDGNATAISPGYSSLGNVEHGVELKLDKGGNLYERAGNLLAKYDPDGILAWQIKFFGAVANDMVVDDQGNLYVTGRGTNPTTKLTEAVVAKYDANGAEVWHQWYLSGSYSGAKKIALGSEGSVVVLAEQQEQDRLLNAVLLTYDQSGVQVAAHVIDFGANDVATGLGLDGQKNMYILVNSANDIHVAKFAVDGTEIWRQRYDTGYFAPGKAIDVDLAGNVAVTGATGNGGYTSNIMLTVKYDSEGVQQWAKKEPGNGYGSWVKIVPTGDVFSGGQTIGYPNVDALMFRYDGCNCVCAAP